ncbi:hypothetical protein ACH42_01975 [Endozoicomonas sp. (ex Bugula neritina AB1)]|nr:hypothetical protein ACH42_01975 [Endozoicomonas sp. (ex Bugula neritina AB1)]
MWGKIKEVIEDESSHQATLISIGTEIEGNVAFSGSLLIEGRVRGSLNSEDGQITLSESGFVEGDIRAPRVVIDGSVRGNVFAMERLELNANAEITGNVYYNVIEMVKGSQVNGSLEHHPNGMPSVTPIIAMVTDETVVEQG